jgi:hypothetical protein
VQPGEHKTIYTDNLDTCTGLATISRVSKHSSYPDNTIVATMNHDMWYDDDHTKKQVDGTNKLINDYQLHGSGNRHAVIVALSERPDSIATPQTKAIFDQVKQKLSGSAELIALKYPVWTDTVAARAPEARSLVVDIDNREPSQPLIRYDLYADSQGYKSLV